MGQYPEDVDHNLRVMCQHSASLDFSDQLHGFRYYPLGDTDGPQNQSSQPDQEAIQQVLAILIELPR